MRKEMPMAGTLRDKEYAMKCILWRRVRIRHLGTLPGRAVRNPLAFGTPSPPDAPPSRRRVWCGQSPTPRRICFTPMAHSFSYVDTMLRVLSRSSNYGSARSPSTASFTACCPGGRWPLGCPRRSARDCLLGSPRTQSQLWPLECPKSTERDSCATLQKCIFHRRRKHTSLGDFDPLNFPWEDF